MNKLLAILCFFGGLAFIVVALLAAPAWVQNIVFGFILLLLSQKFVSNINRDGSSK